MKATIGRPRFRPTKEQREIVSILRASGHDENAIAAYLDIAPGTLRARFRHELDHGALKARAAVVIATHRAAAAGNSGAARVWLQEFAGAEPKAKVRPRKPAVLGKKAQAERASVEASQNTGWAELLGETGSDRPN
jgi:hypothetical protein